MQDNFCNDTAKYNNSSLNHLIFIATIVSNKSNQSDIYHRFQNDESNRK